MRTVLYIVAATTCLMAGLLAALSQSRATSTYSAISPTAAASDRAADVGPPQSLIGRSVQIYFRGADDLPYPDALEGQGQIHLAMKLNSLTGTVMHVQPGWIELSTAELSGQPTMWIPATSVAYIMVQDPTQKMPATQP
ncbi:MAG: hypothetical protein M3O30_15545 [Planctomycetota bacterium]|nr:hypothetical protein [Planctomycetota bacterium]